MLLNIIDCKLLIIMCYELHRASPPPFYRSDHHFDLLYAVNAVNWKTQAFQLLFPSFLQRPHHLARSLQLHKADTSARKKKDAVRHAIPSGTYKFWSKSSCPPNCRHQLSFYLFLTGMEGIVTSVLPIFFTAVHQKPPVFRYFRLLSFCHSPYSNKKGYRYIFRKRKK